MKILVTGGAGFIGSHLCDALIEKGNEVTVIDNLILGKKKNILHLINATYPMFNFIYCDLEDLQRLKVVFFNGEFDMVFHLAANSDIQKGGSNPDVDYHLTLNTTYNVLQCMKEFGVKKLFFASTSAIYGETTKSISEDFGPLQPVSNYGACKLASEALISSFSATYGIQTWIARFPNVVGERSTHGIIFDFIAKLRANPEVLTVLGNGEQNKPYMYVKDLVNSILFIISNSDERFNVFNIGPTSKTKVKEIARMVIDEMRLSAVIEYTGGDRGWVGDVPTFNYNIQKILDIGWDFYYTSNESVQHAIKMILETNN